MLYQSGQQPLHTSFWGKLKFPHSVLRVPVHGGSCTCILSPEYFTLVQIIYKTRHRAVSIGKELLTSPDTSRWSATTTAITHHLLFSQPSKNTTPQNVCSKVTAIVMKAAAKKRADVQQRGQHLFT